MIQSLKPTNQTGKENDMENSNSILEVSVATKAMAFAAAHGAAVLRVHDVKESCDAARVVDILLAHEQDMKECRKS